MTYLQDAVLAMLIDEHAQQFPVSTKGDVALLASVDDYMEAFKRVMDSSTGQEMVYIGQTYPGFYRMGKLLETMAEGIHNGDIDVPKGH